MLQWYLLVPRLDCPALDVVVERQNRILDLLAMDLRGILSYQEGPALEAWTFEPLLDCVSALHLVVACWEAAS